ncbi:MAG: glucose-6-phosphate dehydrogenase [Oleispira antarctica]|uniref:Glucose-6-phosphate 1-dehydrogenase n=1 Tax=Oleispira antarctica RB-8 TaxID=698738 RepID=R4YNV1_OLEAN|nr:glucose-6-phosphate dehydrogenase [Oleispira antarctica]MBQ0794214.1 glucose-6-phosphate dehydrogenase [Oleispira antarctica]CCK76692.1 Glucose-6-phosphate 1-dehydrogenase [Oleispira antarctica RB-8]|tara:strand:+ start:2392 stop:3894 length:1503 start_codon:yes stop_codon:yes gene_type:complete
MQIEQPYELVLFGGLGDLALRKLFPALYLLELDKRLPEGRIIAIGRKALKLEAVIATVKKAVFSHVQSTYQEDDCWQRFADRLSYVCLDAQQPKAYQALAKNLEESCPNRLFYLATASSLYADIVSNLHINQLIQASSKVILEKPIGHDLASAKDINKSVAEYFDETQIYRIDHYLGKETVQNLMVLRFANFIFESQWNQKYIDHIQISISESLGVEKRAGFYEQVGAFRDMMQNHLLQLLCIVAMEPPAKMEPDAVRDEKVKVIKALRPIVGQDILDKVIRGQYNKGVSEGKPVPKYRDEDGVDEHSQTETFVAMKVEIENWRWAGVPFYLRTGKRLAERACEIVVQFKEIPHSIFSMQDKKTMANKLIFRLQPDEGIRLQLCEKKVGSGMKIRPMTLSLNPDDQSSDIMKSQVGSESKNKTVRVPEAYERLLFDALASNPTLFLRDDELMEAWDWVDPILAAWQESESAPESYTAGTWGPAAATLLLAKDGRLWNENN